MNSCSRLGKMIRLWWKRCSQGARVPSCHWIYESMKQFQSIHGKLWDPELCNFQRKAVNNSLELTERKIQSVNGCRKANAVQLTFFYLRWCTIAASQLRGGGSHSFTHSLQTHEHIQDAQSYARQWEYKVNGNGLNLFAVLKGLVFQSFLARSHLGLQ